MFKQLLNNSSKETRLSLSEDRGQAAEANLKDWDERWDERWDEVASYLKDTEYYSQ